MRNILQLLCPALRNTSSLASRLGCFHPVVKWTCRCASMNAGHVRWSIFCHAWLLQSIFNNPSLLPPISAAFSAGLNSVVINGLKRQALLSLLFPSWVISSIRASQRGWSCYYILSVRLVYLRLSSSSQGRWVCIHLFINYLLLLEKIFTSICL